MKTILLLMMVLITSTACKKETNTQKNSDKIISVNLNKSDTLYKNSFGYFGDEEGLSFVKQAKHSAISTIINQPFEERIFQYQPQNNFIGLDTVIIETARGTDGGSKPNVINKTIFIFAIIH